MSNDARERNRRLQPRCDRLRPAPCYPSGCSMAHSVDTTSCIRSGKSFIHNGAATHQGEAVSDVAAVWVFLAGPRWDCWICAAIVCCWQRVANALLPCHCLSPSKLLVSWQFMAILRKCIVDCFAILRMNTTSIIAIINGVQPSCSGFSPTQMNDRARSGASV